MLQCNESRTIYSALNTLVAIRCASGPSEFAFQTAPVEILLRCDRNGDERHANQ
jgi:hypothetical protein